MWALNGDKELDNADEDDKLGVSGIAGSSGAMDIARMTTSNNPFTTQVGDGMSFSNGIWTFPAIGLWKVFFYPQAESAQGNYNAYYYIYTTVDNGSNWVQTHKSWGTSHDQSNKAMPFQPISTYFNITDVSNQKLYFSCQHSGQLKWKGNGSRLETYWTFEKIN